MWADGDPRRSSHFCRLPCKTSHPAGVDPNHCPAFGTGELQENGTTLYRRRRSAMPNNGDVPSDRWTALRSQRNPDCWVDQAAVLKTAPSGTTPSMTNLHSAISSFRARALASNAQATRAILFASATATTLKGRRARSCVSHGYSREVPGTRLEECLCAHQPACHVTGIFMNIAGNLSRLCFGAALHLEGADFTVELGSAIAKFCALVHGASGAHV